MDADSQSDAVSPFTDIPSGAVTSAANALCPMTSAQTHTANNTRIPTRRLYFDFISSFNLSARLSLTVTMIAPAAAASAAIRHRPAIILQTFSIMI